MSSKSHCVLRIELADGRHCELPLEWLRAQLEPQGLHIVRAPAALVLTALDDAPDATLRRDVDHAGSAWRRNVAAAELTRRLDEYAQSRDPGD